jgi:hypothetical protein
LPDFFSVAGDMLFSASCLLVCLFLLNVPPICLHAI